MKKNLWIWALAALSIAACTDEDLPTQQQQVVTENDWISPDGQVVVQLSADGLPTPTTSVGRAIGDGPIDSTDISKLKKLGIFALARGENYTDTTNLLLNNVVAKGRDSFTLDGQIHKDENGQPLKRISLYKNEANRDNDLVGIYYYPITASKNFDFYGYYPYQAEKSNIILENSTVKVEFAMTDGSIDLITGLAAPADSIEDSQLYVDVDEHDVPFIGEADKYWQGYNSRYIRKIKYSNELVEKPNAPGGVEKKSYVPNIKFRHRTTQLRFFVIANGKQSTADKDSTYKLQVDSIRLLNMPKKATWDMVEDKVIWEISNNTPIDMIAKNTDNTAVWKNGLVSPVASISNEQMKTYQAGYLMVAPQEKYELELIVCAPHHDNGVIPEKQTTKVNVKLNDNSKFEEGKFYNIYIQLNALQEINISAELQDWEEGSDVYVPVGEDDE